MENSPSSSTDSSIRENVITFNYIERFSCLADKCEDNCCNDNWRISVNEEKGNLYKDKHPELYKLIARDQGGYYINTDNIDTSNSNNQAPANNFAKSCAANSNGLCKIHRNYGPELLPDTCNNYPRMYRSLNNLYTKAATMSCPEVARLCLFGKDPFAMLYTMLPAHHNNRRGINHGNYPGLTEAKWRQTTTSLINFILDRNIKVEEIILRLYSAANTLEKEYAENAYEEKEKHSHIPVDYTQLPTLLLSTQVPEPSQISTPHENIDTPTPLLAVLIEQLNKRPQVKDIREPLLASFAIKQNDTDAEQSEEPVSALTGSLPFTFDKACTTYYYGAARSCLDSVLKRFMAAEITRTGFPFVSETAAGKDYGHSLKAWTATLIIRVLSLRLLLATGSNTEQAQAPSESRLVYLVYNYCRSANHHPIGACEKNLNKIIIDSEGEYLHKLLPFE